MLDCMNIITLESCHSTWIFDARHLRFCRILRGIAVGQRRISTEWRPYRELEIDPHGRSFTIVLNEARSRLIRSSIHTQDVRALWRLAHDRALARGHQPRRRLIRPTPVGAGRPRGRYRRRAMDDRQSREVEEARLLLDARKELYGESDPATFDAMLQLGRALRDAGQLREAERVLTTSLSLQNRSDTTRRRSGGLDRVQPGHRPRPARRARGGPAALGAGARVLRPGERPRQRALRADGHQPGHHAAQAPSLRRRVPAAGPRPRVDARERSAPTAPRPSRPRSTWPRHTGTSATTTWRSACSPRRSPGLERTDGDQRTILHQKWAIATELVALKRSKEAAEMFDQVVAGAEEHLEPDDPFRRSAVRQRRGYWLLGKFSRRGRATPPGDGATGE